MAIQNIWQRVSDDGYVVDIDHETSLHVLWSRDPSCHTLYFLALSDRRRGLPYEKRPLTFVSYDFDEICPTNSEIAEIRTNDEETLLILRNGSLIDRLPGIPADEKKIFRDFLEKLRQRVAT